MGKHYKKKKKKSTGKIFLSIALTIATLVLVAILVLFVIPEFLYERSVGDGSSGTTTTETQVQSSETTADTAGSESTADSTGAAESTFETAGVEFPLLLEEGKLEIESVFQFEGINPDCDNQEGDNIAAIEVKNTSDIYMKSAAITAAFADGTEHTFEIYELPAGKAVMAFAVDNGELASGNACTEVEAEAVFEEVQSIDSVVAAVDGMLVTVENVTDTDLFGIDVYCRNVFDDKYFGGVTYMYTIEKLTAGESTTIIAEDCILGVADVVRIAIDN